MNLTLQKKYNDYLIVYNCCGGLMTYLKAVNY